MSRKKTQSTLDDGRFTMIRSAFSKLRCGVAPIRIETCRYEGLVENLRMCSFCNLVENEIHVLIPCHLYGDLRETLFKESLECEPHFHSMSTGVIQKVLPVLSTETLLHIWLSTEYYGFRPSSTAVDTWDTRGLMMSK